MRPYILTLDGSYNIKMSTSANVIQHSQLCLVYEEVKPFAVH